MAEQVPGDLAKVRCYKVTQTAPNGAIFCKVFTADGVNNGFGDLLSGVDPTNKKTVEVSALDLTPQAVNLVEFFKSGGLLVGSFDIK